MGIYQDSSTHWYLWWPWPQMEKMSACIQYVAILKVTIMYLLGQKKSQNSCNFSNMSYSWPKACSNFPCVFTSLSNEPNDLRYRLKKRETASQCWLCFIQVQICNVKRQLFFPCQEDYKKFKKRAIQKQLHLWIFQFTKKSLSYQQIRLRLQFFYRFRP